MGLYGSPLRVEFVLYVFTDIFKFFLVIIRTFLFLIECGHGRKQTDNISNNYYYCSYNCELRRAEIVFSRRIHPFT